VEGTGLPKNTLRGSFPRTRVPARHPQRPTPREDAAWRKEAAPSPRVPPKKATLLGDSVRPAPPRAPRISTGPPLTHGRGRPHRPQEGCGGRGGCAVPGWGQAAGQGPPARAGSRQPSLRAALPTAPAAELGERQFQEACFEALTSQKRKRLLKKR